MTLLLGMLLAFVLGWLVGAGMQYVAVRGAVQRGEWARVPGFLDRKQAPPQPKGEERQRWN